MARYEYGPFGERVTAYGALASVNPFRFSTKYQDDETGLYYYGYRYHDPSVGRWLSRDPLEERGGPNLYGFVLNDPENIGDTDGRQLWFFASPKLAQPVSQLEPFVRVGGEIGRTGFENFQVPRSLFESIDTQPLFRPVGPNLTPPLPSILHPRDPNPLRDPQPDFLSSDVTPAPASPDISSPKTGFGTKDLKRPGFKCPCLPNGKGVIDYGTITAQRRSGVLGWVTEKWAQANGTDANPGIITPESGDTFGRNRTVVQVMSRGIS